MNGDPNPHFNWQAFTASGTFNVPAGVSRVWISGCGAGGGGGGGTSYTGQTYDFGGTGGGAGQHAFRYPVDVAPGEAITVTLGAGGSGGAGGTGSSASDGSAGGNTTFGSYLTLDGGEGGAPARSTSSSSFRQHGTRGGGGDLAGYGDAQYAFLFPPLAAGELVGGGASCMRASIAASTGNSAILDIGSQPMHGAYYDAGSDTYSNANWGSGGAGSFWGAGGDGGHYSASPTGASGYGAGGGGGAVGYNQTGGDGSDGYLIVDWEV